MKTTPPAVLAALALAALPLAASAVDELRVALPERHDLVELQPGLQVIPDFELEVAFTGNAYWLRHGGRWLQARRPAATSTFAPADPRAVPPALAALPEGALRYYRARPGQQRSTKVLTRAEPPDREGEVEAGPVKVAPRAAPPPPPPPAKKAPPPPAKPKKR